MNIKTPDYKAQAENLRQTLLNYIDCMHEVQNEYYKIKAEFDELKKRKEDVTLEYVEALKHSCDLGSENFQLKKKIEELKDRIHELETILNIYEGIKHD